MDIGEIPVEMVLPSGNCGIVVGVGGDVEFDFLIAATAIG